MWEHIYLAKEFVSVSCHQYLGTRYARWAIKTTHTCFVFNMIRPWIHLTSDFRRVLSSVIFSRKWLGWHKWITHTKYHQIILILTTIVQVLMPTLKSLVSMMNSDLFSLCFPKKSAACAGAADHLLPWPIQKIFQLVPGLDSARNLWMVLWSCRRKTPEYNHCD